MAYGATDHSKNFMSRHCPPCIRRPWSYRIIFGPHPSRESSEQRNPGDGSAVRTTDDYLYFQILIYFTSVFLRLFPTLKFVSCVSLKNKTRIIHYRHRRTYVFVFLCYRPLLLFTKTIRPYVLHWLRRVHGAPTVLTTLGTWLATVSIGRSNHTTALVVT